MANDFNSVAEQIKQLKQLLDIGAISNDEYEIKKNALLNPEKEAKYHEALGLIKTSTYESLCKAIKTLNSIIEYRDSEKLLVGLDKKAEELRKNEIYDTAVKFSKTNTIESQQKAIEEFNKIIGHKDTNDKLTATQSKLEQLKQDVEEKRIREEKLAEERRITAVKKTKRAKRIGIIVAVITVLVIAFSLIYVNVVQPKQKFNTAMEYINNGDYDNAYTLLNEIGDNDTIAKSKYDRAIEHINKKEYDDAYTLLKEIGDNDTIAKSKYDRAIEHINQKEYENAYALLKEIGDNETISKSKYDRAMELINKKDIEGAYLLLENLDYKDSKKKLSAISPQYEKIKLSKAKKGETITFGNYANNKIEWKVLDKKGNDVLLITKDIIESKAYNDEDVEVTWKKCTLRKWLNNDFYNKSFTDREKTIIKNTKVLNKKTTIITHCDWVYGEHEYKTIDSYTTEDKVFLLSVDESNLYFTSDSERQCKGTKNAKNNGLREYDNGNSVWWVRTHGAYSASASGIMCDGEYCDGYEITADTIGVRPAMWITLK